MHCKSFFNEIHAIHSPIIRLQLQKPIKKKWIIFQVDLLSAGSYKKPLIIIQILLFLWKHAFHRTNVFIRKIVPVQHFIFRNEKKISSTDLFHRREERKIHAIIYRHFIDITKTATTETMMSMKKNKEINNLSLNNWRL